LGQTGNTLCPEKQKINKKYDDDFARAHVAKIRGSK
jgi:hypothetical protein